MKLIAFDPHDQQTDVDFLASLLYRVSKAEPILAAINADLAAMQRTVDKMAQLARPEQA